MRKVLLSIGVALVLPALTGAVGKTDVYAIVDARIVPVAGPVIEKGTIVLRDGVIEAVGKDVRVPADARVIAAQGLTLTPGLIDAFGGIGLPQRPPRRPGDDGGTSDRAPAPLAPDTLALQQIKPAEALKARDTGVTTALVIGSEGVLPGQSVIVNLSGETAEEMVLRQPAALHLHMTALSRQYPGSLMGTMAFVRQSLLDAAHAREEWAAFERSPRGRKRPKYEARFAAWQQVVDGRIPLMVTAFHENDLRRALALADEFKIKVLIAGAPQAALVADLIKTRRLGLILGVNFDPPKPSVSFFGGADEEKEKKDIEDAERAAAELNRAGVAFALGSAHAPDFLAGVRKTIERGLPADEALRALTLRAAETIGVADRTGSLEPGKIANVVAWTGEPLAKDVKVKMVFVDGKLYEPEEKDRDRKGRGEGESRPTGEESTAAAQPAGTATANSTAAIATLGLITGQRMASPAADSRGRTLAIVGGTVLTVGPQGTIENGTVLVRDGKITAVARDLTVPAGATVIDAAGRFVMPGIIDSHAHVAIEGDVNECTDSVTAEVRVTDVLDHRDVGLHRLAAGGVTTVITLHGSCNSIGGQNAVIKLRLARSPEELLFKQAPRGIKFALGENVKRSGERGSGPRRYPGTRMGVEATIRQAFEQALAYKREWEDYEKKVKVAGAKGERPVPPRRDLRLEALKETLEGKLMIRAHAYRADEILMLIHLADEFGIKIRSFEHGLEGYKVASEIARHGAGVATFSDWWGYKMEAFDAIPFNAAVLADHGIRVTLKSDSDELSRRLYWEAAKVVRYGGVSESEALRMITLNAAWQLGIDRYVGSLEAGKDADIAIFSAHPFAPDARAEMTLVDGVVVFDRSKETITREAESAEGGAR